MAMKKYTRGERVEVLSKEEGAKIAHKLGRTACTCGDPRGCDVHGAKSS